MDAAGLDSTYLGYLNDVPADALASVNLMSLFGLHRDLRGAAIGHFASTEITSSPGSRRLVDALERMGAPQACIGFYREHIEADAVHEQVVRTDVVGDLVAREPQLDRDVVFGIRARDVGRGTPREARDGLLGAGTLVVTRDRLCDGSFRRVCFAGVGHTGAVQVSDIAALPVRLGAAVRRRRLFHPDGVLAEGTFERVAAPNEGLPMVSCDVIARVSKGIGLPSGLPDIAGLAWRMPPAQDLRSCTPWDVLLASTLANSRILLAPIASWSGATFSSLMPLRYEGGVWWVRARLVTDIGAPGLSLDAMRDQIDSGEVDFDIEQAAGTGEFLPLARLTLRHVDPSRDDIGFDPDPAHRPGSAADAPVAQRLSACGLPAQPRRPRPAHEHSGRRLLVGFGDVGRVLPRRHPAVAALVGRPWSTALGLVGCLRRRRSLYRAA